MASPSPPDVAGHLQRAGESLGAAAALRAQGYLADSVSRAYYAFFHAGQAMLAMKGKSSRTHRGTLAMLREEFGRPGVKETANLSDFFSAFEFRMAADYEAGAQFSEAEVDVLIAQAATFVRAAQAVVDSTRRT